MENSRTAYPIRLMIIGAQKAGTSSLLYYLAQHPGLCTHEVPEIGFFIKDSEYEQGYARIFERYFRCERMDNPVILAKNVGIMTSFEAMRRLWRHNPHVQLVVSLRHPIDRAYSAYWYARRRGWENLETFEEAINTGERWSNSSSLSRNLAYVDGSIYVNHLMQLLQYFEKKQLHIFLLEDIKCDAVSVCQKLYGLFNELDPKFVPKVRQPYNVAATYRFQSLTKLTSNTTTLPFFKRVVRQLFPNRMIDRMRNAIQRANEKEFKPPPMNPETRTRLVNYFLPYNEQLGEFLGRDLNHWNV